MLTAREALELRNKTISKVVALVTSYASSVERTVWAKIEKDLQERAEVYQGVQLGVTISNHIPNDVSEYIRKHDHTGAAKKELCDIVAKRVSKGLEALGYVVTYTDGQYLNISWNENVAP